MLFSDQAAIATRSLRTATAIHFNGGLPTSNMAYTVKSNKGLCEQ